MEGKVDPRALFCLSYGVYIVGTVWKEKLNGQIANAVMQVTADPVCVAVCLHRDNLTTDLVEKNGFFSVSVLDEDVPMTFIGTFGFKCGRKIDKFEKCNYRFGGTGVPMVTEHSVAVLEARVISSMEVNTHKLFIGEVLEAEVTGEGTPLTYANYHLIKKGKSPRRAPTFVFNELK